MRFILRGSYRYPRQLPTRYTRAHYILYSGKTWLKWPARLCGAATLFNCQIEILSASPLRTLNPSQRCVCARPPPPVHTAYYYIMRIMRPKGILLDDDRTKFPIAECRYILTHIFAAPGGTQFASRTRPAPLAGTFYELKMRMRCLSIYLYTSDNNECVKDR